MAIIAQKQVILPSPRSSERGITLPSTRLRLRSRQVESNRGFMLLACGAAACAMVAYIAGYAAMTRTSRHQVAVQGQIRAAQAERHILHSRVVERSGESLIREWAATHQMVLENGAPVFVGPGRQEGR